ncbi:unnamed protein product [Callosobruchus maculatus]|uniref:Multidrug resistance-associated protein lethal(2)03659 n=1 Tax=Callosobruchus maculatus TaxID=64391 RepID=A0A653D4V1_CALMS|nr:unnamed protein product [Callosobruchus maculatus]
MDHCEKEKRKQNPRERANILSLLTFAYTRGLFRKALKNDLEEKDLYEVLRKIGSKRCGDKMERQWILENKCENKHPSIYHLMWKRFGWRYLMIGLVHLTMRILTSILEPLAMSNLVSYFKPNQTTVTKYDAYYYAAMILCLNLVHCVYIHNYIIWVQQLGIEIKTAFSSLLYRKSLRLTPSAISDISLGNIVTLITKDVYSFQQAIWMINDTWIGVLQTCVICYILYSKIGAISFIGIGFLLAVMPVQIAIGKYVSKLRLTVGKKTDERLQITQEALSTIRIVKMYTWEKFFSDKVNQARRNEVSKMLLGFYLRLLIVILGILFSKLGFYALIMSYSWLGYQTNAELVFFILAIFKDLRHCLGVGIPYGMGRAAELYSAIIRINRVLQGEELHPNYGNDHATDKPLIELKDATVHIKENEILRKISFRTDSGLTLVTGTVGSGKSSLLKTMLQDYPLTCGQLITRGRISYASQDPWLFPSSVKQNILFGQKYDEERYREVVRVCALEYDFSLFDKGDETIVSDRGRNLSKGQQARVNLARAIYKDSEIYLLDDSLTALDAHVQDFIFYECIKKFLKDKVCILVTQTASHIQEADNVVIMKNGEIISCGKPDDQVLQEINKIIVKDDDLEKEVIEDKEANTEEKEKDEQTHLLETEQVVAKKKVYEEINKKGDVAFTVYKKYIMFGGGICLMLLNIALFGLAQGTESYSDQLLTKWVDHQQIVELLEKNLTYFNDRDLSIDNNSIDNSTAINPEVNATSLYQLYNITHMEELIAEAKYKESFTLRLCSAMILVSTVLTLIKTYTLFDFCKRASINVHKAIVKHIVYAVMSFFDTHFIGNILNRFSQDLNNIDEQLPFVFTECFRVMFSVSGIIFLIAIVNINFLLYAFIFFIILYILRKLYLPTGRSLKRLEAATRSPMIGHLNASLEGLTTIRAYKAQDILTDEFDRHQDLFSSAHYTALCTTRAFGFIMDFLVSIFIVAVVAKFIFTDTGTSAGNVGLALTQVFMLAGHVQWGIRQWAELENLMTSVERVLEYTEIKTETTEGTEVDQWPNRGRVNFDNVSLTYGNNEMVLKHLNFKVEPKQKIGIVGRTGAGKSSIIATLFRLYDVDGRITIDGVDIKSLSLKFLRKRLAIIPQDPVLFTGTIRTNLDPIGEFSDQDLWNVLDKVGLKQSVSSLETKITSHGSSYSSGQKQLICLARAILRKTKVVVLDEATANMDHETDALLHNTIKENFADCTVFTIAHRLHSILECDKVMVLDKGEIKEFDDPMSLLDNKNGIFHKMVKQAGLLNYLS